MGKNNKERHPRVFISYSHDSPEHADKILEFAKQLREDGIDAILDQYEPWPDKGWAQWMLQQVSEADFVLMVCTEMYYKGVMDKLAPGEKRGIKYEWNLINNHFYKAGSVNKRFLPVILEKICVEWIPDPFEAMPWFCIGTDEGYEDLYRRLTNQPKTKRPTLGKLKSLEVREVKVNFFVDGGDDGCGGSGGEEEKRRGNSGRDRFKKVLEKGVGIAMILWVIFEISGRRVNAVFCWIIAIVVLLIAAILAQPKIPRRLLKTILRRILNVIKITLNKIPKKPVVSHIGHWAIVAVCTIILTLALTTEAPGLIAEVDCVPWKFPDNMKAQLTTTDICNWCSMYTIGLRTNSAEGVRNPTLKLPEACHIEIKKDKVKKIYKDKEVVDLPSLPCGEQIDIKAWATCKANRPNAERVRITYLGGRPAHLDVRKPVSTLALWTNQHPCIAWCCVGVTICAVLAVFKKLFF